MGGYSSDGMEFSSSTYNHVQLDNTLPENRKPRSQADKATLSTNTDGLINNVNRTNAGDGTVDPMSLADVEELREQAAAGNRGAQEALDEFETSVTIEKDINDAAVSTVKDPETYKELSGYNDAVSTVNAILEGDYTTAGLVAAGILLKPLKVGDNLKDIIDAVEKNGGKATHIDGKIYGKNKKGELVEVKEYEVDEFKNLQKNDVVADNLDSHHAPQKQLAKDKLNNYDSNTAPSIRLSRERHKKISAEQTKNRAKRSKMTGIQLIADDARIMKKFGVPLDKIKAMNKMSRKKYGL